MRLLDGQEEERSGWKGGRAEGSGGGSSPPERDGGGRKARRGEVAIAEPWVGVDSSKPPRLFAPIDAGLPSQSFEEASAGGVADSLTPCKIMGPERFFCYRFVIAERKNHEQKERRGGNLMGNERGGAG